MYSERELKNIVTTYLETPEGRSLKDNFDLARAPELIKIMQNCAQRSRVFEILCDMCRKDLRKENGIYFTPSSVSSYMAAEALDMWCSKHPGYDRLKKIKVLDPACGNGEFLLTMLQLLVTKHLQFDPGLSDGKLIRQIIKNNLYGMDCNKNALEALIFNLECMTGQTVDRRNFVHCDTLDFAEAAEIFPEIKKFDLVIGNPPYISYGMRNCGKLSRERAGILRRRFPDSAEYKLTIYALFMEFALRSTAVNGIQSFIVPDSFLCGQYYSKIRNFMLKNSSFEKFLLLQKKLFRANTGTLVIYFVRKKKPLLRQKFQCALLDGKSGNFPPQHFYTMEQAELSSNFRQRFRLFFDPEIHQMVKRMEAEKVCKLGDILTLSSGLVAKNGKNSIVSTSPPPQKSGNWQKGISSSNAVTATQDVVWQQEYINIDPSGIKSGLGKADYRQPKILIRQTGDRIISAVDENGLYVLNNLHIGTARDPQTDLKALSHYLNSEEMRIYYQSVTLEANRPMAQLDLETLRELPLKDKFFRQ